MSHNRRRACCLTRPDGTQVLTVGDVADGEVLTRSGLTIVGSSGGSGGPHAVSHQDGGTDEVTLAQSQVTGLVTALAAKAMPADITAAVSAHEGAADPHSVYELESGKGAANGYASLDAGTKVPTAQIPDLSATYAPAAQGVTGGNSHDHSGGDGAQVAHSALSGVGTNTHAQVDSHVASTSNPHSVTAAQAGALATAAFSGLDKITVGTTAPGSPTAGSLWIDTN